ncbi:chromate transporter [Caloramator fervidus]|uniref:Chromate transporter n=1 Tax=Caloramator fervidus TaxID=29344 RepID=A0A1H5U3K7_9CLOT|nr:chromate transporter [Caloramator fervidus]SEF68821.1 chromate transporter [Caloramator fervidus]
MKSFELFKTFFKIGAFTLGGGYAMLPLIEKEVVEKKGWIDEEEFLDLVALAQASPGPIAVNTAVFVGYRLMGIKGVLVSTLGSILPSFFIILIIASYFTEMKSSYIIERIFMGIRPAVAGMVLASVFRMGRNVILNFKKLVFVIVISISVWMYKITPIYIILLSILLGLYINFKRGKLI